MPVLTALYGAQTPAAKSEGREIRTPNLLIWSETRCRCAQPHVLNGANTTVAVNANGWLLIAGLCDVHLHDMCPRQEQLKPQSRHGTQTIVMRPEGFEVPTF